MWSSPNVTNECSELRFFQHRRVLLLVSIIFLGLQVTGAHIEKINILGNIFDIENPDFAEPILFYILVYLLGKYILFMAEVGKSGGSLYQSFLFKAAKFFAKNLVAIPPHLKDRNNLVTDVHGSANRGFFNMILHTAIYEKQPGGKHEKLHEEQIRVPIFRKVLILAIVYLRLTFRSTWFLEYIFPPIFGLLPLGSFIYQHGIPRLALP